MSENVKLGVGIAVVVAAFLTMEFGGFSPVKSNPPSRGCTEEALLCPDGSGVGRTGPECRFSPCPNTAESYVGHLRQDGGKFFLDIETPGAVYRSVFSMPLTFRISNAVQDLVGKKIRAYGTFSEGSTLQAETLELVSE
jgi:hypothetical protein